MWEQQKDKKTCLFATVDSRTARRRRISRVTTRADARGLALARVGHVVTYEDGDEVTAIDSAGFAAQWCSLPFALVGSRSDIGDTIVETLQDFLGVSNRADKLIHGLFGLAYAPAAGGGVDAGGDYA